MTLKNDECIYTIKNLTADEVRSIEYAYEQFIHNAVNGDFVLSNPIMEKFKARIEKKSIETQEDSLLIPKPKYKKGDVVKNNYGKEEKWEIEGRYYSTKNFEVATLKEPSVVYPSLMKMSSELFLTRALTKKQVYVERTKRIKAQVKLQSSL